MWSPGGARRPSAGAGACPRGGLLMLLLLLHQLQLLLLPAASSSSSDEERADRNDGLPVSVVKLGLASGLG